MSERSIPGQLAAYAAFTALLVFLSAHPIYRHLGSGEAMIRLSMAVSGDVIGPCRVVTATELARLAPNMRSAEVCPRERSDVRVRLDVDGRNVFDEVAEPRGIARDGAVFIYRRIAVPAGEHRIAVRVATNAARAEDAPADQRLVRLGAGDLLTIDFDRSRGGVVIR